MLIHVLRGSIFQRLLPVTKAYEHTSPPWRRGIFDMLRDTKSKAVSGEKGSPSQDESGSGDMKTDGLFPMMNECFDEKKRFKEEMDSRYKAFQRDIKNTNQRLEELQLRVP